MWSWWDCAQWWNGVGDGTVPWLMFLPMMLWPIVVIGSILTLVVLLMRGAKTDARPTWPDARRQTAFDISPGALRTRRDRPARIRRAQGASVSALSGRYIQTETLPRGRA
jgi:hypothetical protein